MRQAGEVTYADAHKQHRNEGVVEFASHSDMRAAIEKLDGTELNGRRIRLVEDRRLTTVNINWSPHIICYFNFMMILYLYHLSGLKSLMITLYLIEKPLIYSHHTIVS
ncbi:Splicing factor arginine/serine-rich 6 [Operophtera brumata]|uniref:Splicing factor arginine/serine-rich 6 n=1 Tax=Operophtera brumata TaxID=104452 RepID=A0A0L7L2P2_OPEBR|nr:Splicing factor arginine/serine-rich 6 [Operophtera brumata]